MTKRRLKKSIAYALYALSFLMVIGTIFLLESSGRRNLGDDDNRYINDTILDREVPVVATRDVITRPYTDSGIAMVKGFYSYQDEIEEQENAILYFENTYLQNSGVAYSKNNESFDVKAILDGVVISVKDNSLLGRIVEIRHSNDLISVYQSLSEVRVQENEEILQGQVIGISGTANIATSLGNHLRFELIHNGINVNPENYYDKKIDDL